jgi:hypothetical protein
MPTFTTTTKYALRWLTGTNLISDIDAGFQALAEDVDSKFAGFSAGVRSSRPPSTSGSPGIAGRRYRSTDTGQVDEDTGTGWRTVVPALVTALPGSPDDGQEVDFVADATDGVIWRFRYRAASSSAYKWEFVGGPPLTAEVAAFESTAVLNSYVDLATIGPSITVQLAGEYLISLGAHIQPDTGDADMAPALGAIAATDANSVSVLGSGATVSHQAWRTLPVKSIATGSLIQAKYKNKGGTPHFSNRMLVVLPVRV